VTTAALPRLLRWTNAAAVALVALVIGGYVAVCVSARLRYREALYPVPPEGPPTLPSGARWLEVPSKDGASVHAAFFPPPTGEARTAVIFHGNGETISNGVGLAEDLHARGLGALLFEYRGYGVSKDSGPPSERGIYDDAERALDSLAASGIGPSRVALVGFSLGTGVAAEMAHRGRGASLTLVSPYTSMVAMGELFVPWLPVAWLLPDKFDTLSKAPAIKVPTLVAHGDADEVVPFEMGRRVATAVEGATWMPFPGGHHADLFSHRAASAAEAGAYPASGLLIDAIAAQAQR
jgi:alpha-beta hydrolase superfamily lysophospholipase